MNAKKAARPDWITDKDGRVRFFVLKPFKFNVPVKNTHTPEGINLTVPNTRSFVRGEYFLNPDDESDAAVLGHHWIYNDLADGAVEHPDKTLARLQAEADAAVIQAQQRQELLTNAKIALQRTQAQAAKTSKSGRAQTDELDTPLNQLGAGGSAHQDEEPNLVPSDEELNTPLNQLPKAGQ